MIHEVIHLARFCEVPGWFYEAMAMIMTLYTCNI